MNSVYFYQVSFGMVAIGENGKGITKMQVVPSETLEANEEKKETPLIKKATTQLTEYLEGTRKRFDLSFDPQGTDFQKRVWKALEQIPYGETRSYKQIAEVVGSPKGFRAVGMANNKNPIGILVPCHRVIGANGALVGYAGGLDRKIFLLELEQQNK